MGCTAQVWLTVRCTDNGTVALAADSDSGVSRGLAAVLVNAFQGATPAQIDTASIEELDQLAVGPVAAAESRTNAFRNMFRALQKRARALTGELPVFPSLLITADALQPQGQFAEAQARFLQPDTVQVDVLAQALQQKQVGVVAHFYMDPQVQGVLTSAAAQWPHIAISGACRGACVLRSAASVPLQACICHIAAVSQRRKVWLNITVLKHTARHGLPIVADCAQPPCALLLRTL